MISAIIIHQAFWWGIFYYSTTTELGALFWVFFLLYTFLVFSTVRNAVACHEFTKRTEKAKTIDILVNYYWYVSAKYVIVLLARALPERVWVYMVNVLFCNLAAASFFYSQGHAIIAIFCVAAGIGAYVTYVPMVKTFRSKYKELKKKSTQIQTQQKDIT